MLKFRPHVLVFLALGLLLILSCATVIMPNGGAKDITPPAVIGSYPVDKSKNFADNQIVLAFDEFVDFVDINKSILVSPYLKEKVKASIIGKKLKLFLPTLLPNTTYSIKLTNAIKDYNEGNLLSKYQLNFSTGKTLDTGKLKIKLINRKGNISNETVVALVEGKSQFFSNNFKYISRLENEVANYDNLNSSNYQAYAFVDSNLNMKWDKNEQVGFVKEDVKAEKENLKLELFQNESDSVFFQTTPLSSNEFTIHASQDIYDVSIDDKSLKLYNLNFRSIKIISNKPMMNKSITLKYNQSKSEIIKLPSSQKEPEIAILELDKFSRDFDSLRPDSAFIYFNSYISSLDTSKIELKKDTNRIRRPMNYSENRITITGLSAGSNYSIVLDSGAILQNGKSNAKPISYNFSTYKDDGKISELIIVLDTSLLNKPTVIYQVGKGSIVRIEKKPKLVFRNVYEKNINFHIFIDQNKNNTWDSGNVDKERAPEPYYIENIIFEPNKKEYILKLNNP